MLFKACLNGFCLYILKFIATNESAVAEANPASFWSAKWDIESILKFGSEKLWQDCCSDVSGKLLLLDEAPLRASRDYTFNLVVIGKALVSVLLGMRKREVLLSSGSIVCWECDAVGNDLEGQSLRIAFRIELLR